jgi:hypothetical protein
MNTLLKNIQKTRAHLAAVNRGLAALEKRARKKVPKKKKAPQKVLAAVRGGAGIAAAAAPAPSASKRARVVVQLIGILHSDGKTDPSIGPGSVYANPPIGYGQPRMNSYSLTCQEWFGCVFALPANTITVNQMATLVLNAGGEPR